MVTDTLPTEIIMIVDDEPENLNVLAGMLEDGPWDVCAFPRGDLAVQAALQETPDLVLLDIRMPGIDGYETCRRFKNSEMLRDVPIIFLSALSNARDKEEAFQAGGVDYVTKPFHESEVLLRVKTQLALRRQTLRLEELVKVRTAELNEAHHRLQVWDDAKTSWLTALAHEMRTPLTGIIGTAEVLLADAAIDPDMQVLRHSYDESLARINKLMDDAMLLTQIPVASKEFDIGPVDLYQLLDPIVESLQAKVPNIRISQEKAVVSPKVEAESDLLCRALESLMATAECCVLDEETLQVRVGEGDDGLIITIATDGQTLPQEALDSFFEVGGQRITLKGGGDFGLGPALACRILELFNGQCSVANGAAQGIVITLLLPRSS